MTVGKIHEQRCPRAAVRLVADAEAVASGAVLAVGGGGAGAADDFPYDLHMFGHTRSGPEARPVTQDTIFDLASLTKVVATTPAVLRLADAGELGLDDAVARYLPAYAPGEKSQVTLRHLLTHSAGLPAHRPFHEAPAEGRMAAVLAEPLVAEPGTRVCYSDVGFMVLGHLVSVVAGAPLDRAARELVFDPLGMAETGYLPDAPRERFAATEPCPDTGEPKIGVVHDENAAALGGVAGHAGLFGTVGDLIAYLRSGWLGESDFLSAATRRAAVTCWTEGLGGWRGLGWTLAGDTWDHMTAAWPQTRAGHTGFTGTSLAFDPESGLWTVLLTNAVHRGRDHAGIALLRRTVHAAVGGWFEAGPRSAGIAAATSASAPVGEYDRAVPSRGDR